MDWPNFFILGGPKCGTTAMATWLRDHPAISMCSPKEPHFFARDLPGHRFVDSKSAYLELFEPLNEDIAVRGDASVFYLYSKCAAQEIAKVAPGSKHLVMLRNPLDLVRSFHSQLCYTTEEDVDSLEEAYSLCTVRRTGERIPRRSLDDQLLYYDEIAKFGEQLERLYQSVPESNVEFVFFEDFVSNPEKAYKKVLAFLGLPFDGRHDFEDINQKRRHRIKLLGNLTQRPPPSITAATRIFKKGLGVERLGLLKKIKRLNLSREPRPKPADALRARILSDYEQDIALLSRLINKNLDSWLNA